MSFERLELQEMKSRATFMISCYGIRAVIENMPLPMCKLIRRLGNGWSLDAALTRAEEEQK